MTVSFKEVVPEKEKDLLHILLHLIVIAMKSTNITLGVEIIARGVAIQGIIIVNHLPRIAVLVLLILLLEKAGNISMDNGFKQ